MARKLRRDLLRSFTEAVRQELVHHVMDLIENEAQDQLVESLILAPIARAIELEYAPGGQP
jgi:hypothetical protein